MKLIYIEWADAIANSNWFSHDDAMDWIEESEWIIRQVGWVLRETPQYIVLAAAWKPEDNNTIDQYHLIQKIPKTWIRKRKVIKL